MNLESLISFPVFCHIAIIMIVFTSRHFFFPATSFLVVSLNLENATDYKVYDKVNDLSRNTSWETTRSLFVYLFSSDELAFCRLGVTWPAHAHWGCTAAVQ